MESFDAFALGSILFEIKYMRFLPRVDRNSDEYMEALEEVGSASDSMSNLISGLLAKAPERLTIEQALAHPWLNPSEKYRAAAILFNDPIEEDEDLVSRDAGAQSADLEVPAVDQAAHSSPIAEKCIAVPEEEPKVAGERRSEQRPKSLSSAYRLCSEAKNISHIEAQALVGQEQRRDGIRKTIRESSDLRASDEQMAPCPSQLGGENKSLHDPVRENVPKAERVKTERKEQQVFDRVEEF